MKRFRKLVLLLLPMLLPTTPLFGQSWLVDEPGDTLILDNSGLRVESYKDVAVVVVELDEAARELGLSEERIRSVVVSRLEDARLRVVEYRQEEARKRDGAFLQVEVRRFGEVCEIALEFRRLAVYTVVYQRYYTFGTTTWRSRQTTVATGADSVLPGLDRQLRHFVRSYLDAN